MGYSHYYRQKRDMTPEEFEGFAKDVLALAQALPKTLGEFDALYGFGGYEVGGSSVDAAPLAVAPGGRGGAIVGEDWVNFNGAGFEDADHEDFFVERKIDPSHWSVKMDNSMFRCTKTARKPYDVMVCAAMLALASRAPGAWKLSSDGDCCEWVAAARFARAALGRAMPLGKVSEFSKQTEDLAAAREKSAPEIALKEARELAKAARRPVGASRKLKAGL